MTNLLLATLTWKKVIAALKLPSFTDFVNVINFMKQCIYRNERLFMGKGKYSSTTFSITDKFPSNLYTLVVLILLSHNL